MKRIFIDAEAEQELADSVAFYESRRPGLGLEFEQVAREAVIFMASNTDGANVIAFTD